MKMIDVENHFFTIEYLDYLRARKTPPRETITKAGPNMWYNRAMSSPRSFEVDNKMADLGSTRLQEMDANGIDVEILSLSPPGIQRFAPQDGTRWARKINTALAQVVNQHPDRFVGFACLAPQDPVNAVAEVKRSAALGLKGIVLHSHVCNEYLDDRKYWGIFEQAAQHLMPIFIHPELPSNLILRGYAAYGFQLAGPVLGFAADVALHAMRLICSGLFDQYPTLQVILGHLGEGLPFWLDRIDIVAVTDWKRSKMHIQQKPSDYIKHHFTMLTSGMHYLPAFMCAYSALGAGRLAFGTDYPYAPFSTGVKFLQEAPIPATDKEKIFSGTITKLLHL